MGSATRMQAASRLVRSPSDGPGDYTPGLFQNGVATAFAGPGAMSVNAAGQTVGDAGNGRIYWDRLTGTHRYRTGCHRAGRRRRRS